MSFKIKSLSLAVIALSTTSLTHAAGLDRSTQPSWGFTQDGTFAYVENITIDPKIAGNDNKNPVATSSNYVQGKKVADMADNYNFLNYGAKTDINDTVSVGAFFDQPWGADVSYHGDNNFVAKDADTSINQLTGGTVTDIKTANATLANLKTGIAGLTAQLATTTDAATKAALQAKLDTLSAQAKSLGTAATLASINGENAGQGTKVNLYSQNFTGLVGVKLGEKKNFQVYGGPAIQKLEADIHLRGLAYKGANGYDATLPQNTAVGWVAGVAYSKPEIALKASLTYRSEIDHDTHLAERFPALGQSGVATNKVTITTPESYNLDFQTGLNPTTLLTAKARYVPWSKFHVRPKVYGKASGTDLVSYDKDSWSGEVGLGKKLSDKFAVSGSVGWDSGAGNPITSLGPVEGNWNVGLGAKYNMTPEWALSAGVKYLKFGDAKAELPDGSIVGDFKDNDGMVYGVRLTYQKK